MPEQPFFEYAKILIAVAGFTLVILQLSYVKRSMESNANAKLYDQYLKINEFFLHKPHLRPYFYDGEVLSDQVVQRVELKGQIETMCEAIAGVLEHAALQGGNLADDPLNNCWKAYMKERFQKSPALRQYFANSQDWYALQFHDALRELRVSLPARAIA